MSDHTPKPVVALQETLYTSANPTRRRLHATRRDWVIERLQRYAPPNGAGRALEIGPGSGIYLPRLAELCGEVTASDVEPAFLDHAREIARSCGNIKVVSDDITNSQLPERRFDLILCSEVIEHIRGTDRVLRAARALLAPRGVLILTTPQRFSALEMTAKLALSAPLIWFARRVYREPVEPLGHINLLTAGALAQELRRAGFAIREQDVSGLYLPGIAEWGAVRGNRLLTWLERCVHGGPFQFLLWTQKYVAVQAADPPGDVRS